MEENCVSIISFVGETIQLQIDDLKNILENENIKNREVAVVTIMGAYRQGKSFLLNFFLKYLYTQYDRHDINDWINVNNQLMNGFKWKNGRQRETTGINMWSHIFTYDFSDGRKVAILLIDTQGIFDGLTSQKQSTAIFALGTLISSVKIYNVMFNIQEDHLQHLQFFTEYGRLMAGESTEKPFQKLLFVVRDWQYGDTEGFGLESGGKIINDTLNIENVGRSPEMNQLRERISSSFEEICAFLMPSPGSNVRRNNFEGDLKEIDQEFLKYIRELTYALFAPDNLLVKKINGQAITAQNWIQYLEGYVKAFNNPNFEVGSLLMATAKIGNKIISSKSEEYYVREMSSTPSARGYFTENEFSDIHLRAKNKSIAQFVDAPKIGGNEFAGLALKELEVWIEHTFLELEEGNKRQEILARRKQYSRAKQMKTNFEKGMKAKIDNHLYLNDNEIFDLHERMKHTTISEFNNGTVPIPSILQELEDWIDEIFVDLRNTNNKNRKFYEDIGRVLSITAAGVAQGAFAGRSSIMGGVFGALVGGGLAAITGIATLRYNNN